MELLTHSSSCPKNMPPSSCPFILETLPEPLNWRTEVQPELAHAACGLTAGEARGPVAQVVRAHA